MSKALVRTTTNAKVTLTIELTNLGSWGPDCKIDQVYRQALEAAHGRVRNAFTKDLQGIKIVGTPKIEAITTSVEVTR